MDKQYTYNRKDGGTTECYGKLDQYSNIQVTCDNEWLDGVITDNVLTSWQAVCKSLEKNYNGKIEELTAI